MKPGKNELYENVVKKLDRSNIESIANRLIFESRELSLSTVASAWIEAVLVEVIQSGAYKEFSKDFIETLQWMDKAKFKEFEGSTDMLLHYRRRVRVVLGRHNAR
jgi:hypothetical protein